ncbi:MAG TPA: ABC transporter ATP-binding protein [Candidatus Subteraquimicrobiales bacterium]
MALKFKSAKKNLSNGSVIEVKDLWKKFRIYHEKHQSLKETFLKRKRVSYEEFWAVKGISFSLSKGDTLGIIGENGSGKTSLLKILAHILRPDEGTYRTEGKVSALLELGAGFHPELTGRENIYLNGSILGMKKSEIDAKFTEIVAFSGLEKFIDNPVKSYSSGMYLRLGFSVAIKVDPEILLIDEILAVGDESFQRKCADKILEFKLHGKTIVIVSHDLNAVRNLCDSAIWIQDGCIKKQGPSEEVVNAYLAYINQGETASNQGSGAENFGTRHGTHEVEITKVEFLNAHSQQDDAFQTGGKFVARLTYEAHQSIENPVFGVAIFGSEGTQITGPNTKIDNRVIGSVQGKGYVDYIIEELPLLPGSYLFSAAIYDESCLHAYDHQEKMHMFKVKSGVGRMPQGTIQIPCQWKFGDKMAESDLKR